MMLKLKNKIEGLIWASSRETKCPEEDSILSLKNQQPDTITGDFLAHRLIINNVDWVHAELAWHKDMKEQHKLNNTEHLQGRGHWWLQPCVGTTAFPVSLLKTKNCSNEVTDVTHSCKHRTLRHSLCQSRVSEGSKQLLSSVTPGDCVTFMLPQSDTGRKKVKKTDCVYLRDVRSQKKAKK